MLISVCIPTVRATTLQSAIESVRRQTWANWELIVVSQGHDTRVRAVVEAIRRQDGRIHHVHTPEMGVSRARNAGIAASVGEVIAMTDDDCETHPEWLATLAACFKAEPEVGLVGGSLVKPPQAQRPLASCPTLTPAEVLYDPIHSGRRAPPGWDWIGGNFALRRAVVDRVGP